MWFDETLLTRWYPHLQCKQTYLQFGFLCCKEERDWCAAENGGKFRLNLTGTQVRQKELWRQLEQYLCVSGGKFVSVAHHTVVRNLQAGALSINLCHNIRLYESLMCRSDISQFCGEFPFLSFLPLNHTCQWQLSLHNTLSKVLLQWTQMVWHCLIVRQGCTIS